MKPPSKWTNASESVDELIGIRNKGKTEGFSLHKSKKGAREIGS